METKIKIKRFYVEAKKSRNFQTYTVGLDIEVPAEQEEEDVLTSIREAQQRCRKMAVEQLEQDKR